MAQESKYASKLRELGFRHVPRKVVAKARKKLGKCDKDLVGLQPTFSPYTLITYATDETGQSWFAPGKHDLTALGFINSIYWYTNLGGVKKH